MSDEEDDSEEELQDNSTQTKNTVKDAQTQDEKTEEEKKHSKTKDGSTEAREPCECAPKDVCSCKYKPLGKKKSKQKQGEEEIALEQKESPCTCAPKTVCKCKRKPRPKKKPEEDRCAYTNPTKDPCHKCDPDFKKRKPPEGADDPFMSMFDDQEPTEKIMLTKMDVDESVIVQNLCHKVTVLGSGVACMACIVALLTQHITSNIVVFDTNLDKAIAEIMDLQSATVYLNNAHIFATQEIKDTTNSKVLIVGPDFDDLKDTDDIGVAKGNHESLKGVIPDIISKSPNCVIINAAYPYDLMTYVLWKLATSAVEDFSSNRVLGLGNAVASARLRFLVGCQLDVSPSSCRALIIGETGKTCVPIWSSVTAGAVRLQDINPRAGYSDDPETWHELGLEAADIDEQIRSRKNAPSSWAPGIILASITRSILHNTMECYTLSTYVKGCRHGQDKDVFMSLPCVIGARGVMQISKQPLGEWERESLQATANYFHENADTLQLGEKPGSKEPAPGGGEPETEIKKEEGEVKKAEGEVKKEEGEAKKEEPADKEPEPDKEQTKPPENEAPPEY